MVNKKLKNLNIKSFFWFLLYIFPFFYMLMISLNRGFIFDINFLSQFNNLFISLFDSSIIFSATSSTLNFLVDSSSVLGIFVCSVVSWWILILLARVCVSVISFIPDACVSLFEKIGGDD